MIASESEHNSAFHSPFGKTVICYKGEEKMWGRLTHSPGSQVVSVLCWLHTHVSDEPFREIINNTEQISVLPTEILAVSAVRYIPAKKKKKKRIWAISQMFLQLLDIWMTR